MDSKLEQQNVADEAPVLHEGGKPETTDKLLRHATLLLEEDVVETVPGESEASPTAQSKLLDATLEDSAGVAPTAETKLLAYAPEEEWPGIRRSVKEVEKATANMEDGGLSQVSFFIGVINIALSGFVLGRWPQHFWILYAIKVLIYIPTWFVEVTRRYNGSLFVLDFCWVTNISLGLYMLANLFFGPRLDPQLQRWAFLWFYASAMGPLSWAALALQNGLVFHSIERTATLFIHFTPCIVAWTLRWDPDTVIAAWPDRFSIHSLEEANVGQIYLAGIGAYTVWLLFHGTWLLTCGVNAPAKGYATVFNDLYEKNKLAEKFEKVTGFKSVRSHAAIYLFLHAMACSLSFTWSMLCYRFWLVHTVFAGVLMMSVVWIGAGYYMYMFKKVYSKALHKLVPSPDMV